MAKRRAHVPKFGSWDASEGNYPYTQVFENAREGRARFINPNDPCENPEAFGLTKESNEFDTKGDDSENGKVSVPHRGGLSGHENGDFDSGGPQRSPLHQQAKMNGKVGSASPLRDRRVSADGGSTPGRSRLRSPKPEDPVEKGQVLPKFGAWDANNPASADGFTMIFDNARNEKKAGGAIHVPPLTPDNDLYPGNGKSPQVQSKSSNRKWLCCFQPAEA